MSKTRIVQFERHPLSDGGLAIVTREGRKYAFCRIYPSGDREPDSVHDIRKAEAYRLLEDALKRDVLELD